MRRYILLAGLLLAGCIDSQADNEGNDIPTCTDGQNQCATGYECRRTAGGPSVCVQINADGTVPPPDTDSAPRPDPSDGAADTEVEADAQRSIDQGLPRDAAPRPTAQWVLQFVSPPDPQTLVINVRNPGIGGPEHVDLRFRLIALDADGMPTATHAPMKPRGAEAERSGSSGSGSSSSTIG